LTTELNWLSSGETASFGERVQMRFWQQTWYVQLGYYPASLDPKSIARCRKEAAERQARQEAAGTNATTGRHKWDHLKEDKRRTEAEADAAPGGRSLRVTNGLIARLVSSIIH